MKREDVFTIVYYHSPFFLYSGFPVSFLLFVYSSVYKSPVFRLSLHRGMGRLARFTSVLMMPHVYNYCFFSNKKGLLGIS